MRDRLSPGLSSPQYAVRQPLLEWLRRADVDGLRVIDVGCGDRRYDALFGRADSVVGFDVPGNAHADIHGSIEAIPVDDASFDVALCLQVLEHVPDPGAAIRELRRVVKPGGRVLASTHGVAPFHPNPEDLWRWTSQGLERSFSTNAEWTSLAVTPASGTAAATAMLVAQAVDLVCKRAHVRPLAAPVVYGLNVGARAIDRAVPELASTRPGTLHANYHVEAVA